MTIVLDKRGVPVMLADVAPSGVSKIDPNATSGNPAHDTRSGKFGTTGGGGGKRVTAPANVDQAAYLRMLDAIREAARTYSGRLTPENIQAFIKKRAANPGAVNIQAFLQAAAAQQMHDVVDVLDQELRTVRGPKLTAPQGYVSKILKGASDDDVAEIVAWLAARGNSAEKAAGIVMGKAGRARKEKIAAAVQKKTAQVTASDYEATWESDENVELAEEKEKPLDPVQLVNALAEKISIPAPIVNLTPNITVEVEAPKPTRRVVERDDKNLITGFHEVPVEDAS